MTRQFEGRGRKSYLTGVLTALLTLPVVAAADTTPWREWTLNDSIVMPYFSDTQDWPELWPARNAAALPRDPAVSISPDGSYFFVVTHHGVLERDSNLYELTVYATNAVRRALDAKTKQSVEPLTQIRHETISSNLPALLAARWQPGGRAITYLGMKHEKLEVYRLDLPSGTVTQLTDLPDGPGQIRPRSPTAYLYRDGGVIVSLGVSVDVDPLPPSYPMVLSRRRANGDASRYAEPHITSATAYVAYGAPSMRRLDGVFSAWSIQPGGGRAVAIRETSDRKGKKDRRFVLVDLEHGTVAPLLDAPVGPGSGATDLSSGQPLPPPRAEWSADGQRVVLVNTRLPEKVSRPPGATATVEYDVTSENWKVLKWNSKTKSDDASKAAPSLHGLSVFVQQSENDPAALVATDGRRRLELMSTANSIAGIRRAAVEPIEWRERDGKVVRGQLMLPQRTEGDSSFPLIVELVHDVHPGSFLPDGPLAAAYASQVYAAQGFAVLRVPHFTGNEKLEGPLAVERLDLALAAVTASHPRIDRSHIGAIGHSRTGFQVLYAMIHPGREHFAAAAIIDSYLGTYISYIGESALGGSSEPGLDYKEMPGGQFWERKAEWLQHEPTFNLDRVTTPALFALHKPAAQEYMEASSEIMGAFNLNRRPLEYIWIPTGSHMLLRPKERLAEMGTVLEWMKFWLKEQAPADADLAARWEPLRELQRAVLSKPLPPPVKWVPVPTAPTNARALTSFGEASGSGK